MEKYQKLAEDFYKRQNDKAFGKALINNGLINIQIGSDIIKLNEKNYKHIAKKAGLSVEDFALSLQRAILNTAPRVPISIKKSKIKSNPFPLFGKDPNKIFKKIIKKNNKNHQKPLTNHAFYYIILL